jgi:uncharacterized membrane protein
MGRRIVFGIWFASLAVVVVQAAAAYPEMPDRVATHFDVGGRPNGWSSKPALYVGWAAHVSAANAIAVAVALLMPVMLSKTPRLVNLPRKRYWLATPERRARASRVMQCGTMAVAAAINVLFGQIFARMRDYAVNGTADLDAATLLVPFAVVLVGALAYMFATLLRAPGEGTE